MIQIKTLDGFNPLWYILQKSHAFYFLDLYENIFHNTESSGFFLKTKKALVHIPYTNTHQGLRRRCHISRVYLISQPYSSLLFSTWSL